MSFIPLGAVHAAATPVQRTVNEQIRARKVQAEKASHHTEDVEELDDTAVNTVEERRQRGGQKDRGKRKEEPQEKVEIAALDESAVKPGAKLSEDQSHLDISA